MDKRTFNNGLLINKSKKILPAQILHIPLINTKDVHPVDMKETQVYVSFKAMSYSKLIFVMLSIFSK